ncbi:MAG: ROK family protein [Thermomicrobiales bacterium]
MPAKYAIGIDVGGTKVLASIVDVATGSIAGSAKKRSNPDDSPEELVEKLFSVVDEATTEASLPKKAEITGIGVGIAGVVDSANGVLLSAPNLSQATVDLPLATLLSERYGVPARLLNDVQVAAIGEAVFGAGAKVADFMCVFVGTGVGGAYLRDGKLIRGATGSAGEIGHLIVDSGGRHCGCGGRGHLEAYASRTAITTDILSAIKLGRRSVLTKLVPDIRTNSGALRSGVLAKAVEEKDALAVEAIQDAGNYLGLGLASVINLLNPTRIIIGGGVIESVPMLFEVAAKRAKRESLEVPGKAVEIVRAKLGDYSGVSGAALLGSGDASQITD